MAADNPYAEQTAKNASTPWLAGGPAVDVDLDGLRAYASSLASQQADIASRAAYLRPLGEIPEQAFTGEVLGEADAVRARLVANAGELTVYLQKLAESVGNIGSAARTVADSYGAGDAVSAASLNDVLFAYGDPNAPRPDGLPAGVGATYRDQQSALATLPPAADSRDWTVTADTPLSAYQTMQTATGPNGERREVMTFTPPGGATTVTTTIFGSNGETVSSVTTRTSTRVDGGAEITVRESFGADGKPAGTTETRTEFDGDRVVGQSTEVRDGNGETVHRTVESTDPATREQVQVVSERNEKGELVEKNRIVTGIATSGARHRAIG
ncbi:hypothetical protein Aph02nite_20890 [Actinoplanes philippinensis]|uniref:Uncharacterized protein n=1 Tax=Actinoplanes philippinensis TaxID=35752 RepID=A0A1I2BVU4_9ACTN|nr:hypothetical protein [Actinoplanes philippinensis]GIE76139.1 hypothetical protein Aph02nite_20890 [Actinoplanes philippinensis]SFE60125.1 hypothetical protein SAMN05421541_102554 [Actinoplanes philippinensis]